MHKVLLLLAVQIMNCASRESSFFRFLLPAVHWMPYCELQQLMLNLSVLINGTIYKQSGKSPQNQFTDVCIHKPHSCCWEISGLYVKSTEITTAGVDYTLGVRLLDVGKCHLLSHPQKNNWQTKVSILNHWMTSFVLWRADVDSAGPENNNPVQDLVSTNQLVGLNKISVSGGGSLTDDGTINNLHQCATFISTGLGL